MTVSKNISFFRKHESVPSSMSSMIPTKKSIGLSSNNAVKVAVPRILESEVKTTHLLGEGAYGQVWKGTCRSNPVAVKYIHPEKYNPESFLAELTILFQVFFAPNNSTVGDCHLITTFLLNLY